MSKRIQRRRGTTAEHAAFAGAEGEITIDTDKDVTVIHDGVTFGGFPTLREDLANVDAIPARAAMGLGSVVTHNLALGGGGTGAIGEIYPAEDFSQGAFLNTGTNAGELFKFAVTNELQALDAHLLYNLPQTLMDSTNTANNNVIQFRVMTQNNLDIQLLADGLVDNFETQNGIATEVGATFDTGGNYYHNGNPTPGIMAITSNTYVTTQQPNFADITIIAEDVDPLNWATDITVEVSRDAGITFNNTGLVPRGPYDYPPGPRKITTGQVDLTTQPTGTNLVWKVNVSGTVRARIHSVAINWR